LRANEEHLDTNELVELVEVHDAIDHEDLTAPFIGGEHSRSWNRDLAHTLDSRSAHE
jgi:hypothetical protein